MSLQFVTCICVQVLKPRGRLWINKKHFSECLQDLKEEAKSQIVK